MKDLNKMIVFNGLQRHLVTCYNPWEIIQKGAFNGNYKFLSIESNSLLEKRNKSGVKKVKTDNLFSNAEGCPLVGDKLEFRQYQDKSMQFFDWYIKFYYKAPGWFKEYSQMWDWYHGSITQLGVLMAKAKEADDIEPIKQLMLQQGWDWRKNPAELLPQQSPLSYILESTPMRKLVPESSNVDKIGYLENLSVCVVKFHSGKSYAYYPVAKAEFDQLKIAQSLGSTVYNILVKDKSKEDMRLG